MTTPVIVGVVVLGFLVVPPIFTLYMTYVYKSAAYIANKFD